jgi:hypothetical protein
MIKWLPPHGFTGKVHAMDARVGGGYRMSFTNFSTGRSHSFGGRYVELTPHERIRYTDGFDDPALPGEMRVTIALRKVDCGTELQIVQEGVPSLIPIESRYLGWQSRCRCSRSSSRRRFRVAGAFGRRIKVNELAALSAGHDLHGAVDDDARLQLTS